MLDIKSEIWRRFLKVLFHNLFCSSACLANIRNSRSHMLFEIGVLNKFATFTGKNTCARVPFLIKLQPSDLQFNLKIRLSHRCFSCEFCEILKYIYFEEHLQTAASENSREVFWFFSNIDNRTSFRKSWTASIFIKWFMIDIRQGHKYVFA